MAVTTLNATTNQGYVRSTASNYSNMRAGTGTKTLTQSTTQLSGQQFLGGTHYMDEAFLEFDTSTITGTITSVVLKVYITNIYADNSFTCQARLYDYGTSLTTADWVPGNDVSGDTLLATLASGSMSASAYNSFTDVAFPANINTSGKTRIYLASDNFASATSPGSNERETFIFQSPTGANPPQLVITTSDPQGALTQTVGTVTLASTVGIETFGVVSQELGLVTLSAAGEGATAGAGSLNQEVGSVTLSAAVQSETNAYLEATVGEIYLATGALLPLEGELTASIEVSLSGIIARNTEGALSQTVGTISLATSTDVNLNGELAATVGTIYLSALESGPAWPVLYDFPQTPLTGTLRRERGDDTLRSDREVGARQYRAQSGGNYADVTFTIQLKSNDARDLLDRFYRDDCKNGAGTFYWTDPETGEHGPWAWAAPPQITALKRGLYRVDCALLKEAA